MRTKNKKLLVIVAVMALALSLIPALTLTAATEDFGTQREYVVAMIKSAGLQDSLIGTVVRDQDMLAESLGFLDNWVYNPTATVTEEIAAEMDLVMADAKNGLRDALLKDPPEPYFVHGMAQPIFPYGNSTYYDTSGEGVARFLVYVETDYDTDGDGKLDLIKVMVQLPRAAVEKGMKCASIYHAQPYNEGTNDGVSYPENVRAEGQAWLNENGPYTKDMLLVKVPPRTPASEITTKQLVDNQLLSTQPWRDWRYSYSYSGKPATTATVTWGVANGNQVGSLNMHDYFAVRGYALISTAGIGTLAGEGLSTYGAEIEIAAYKKVIEWLNGEAVAYTDKTSNIQIKADWSNGFACMTGTSYGGTVPNGVASTGVKGLETIIPVCGIISYYEYQNQQGAANWGAQYTPGMVWYILSSFGRADWVPTNPLRAKQMGYMQQMYWEAMELNNQYGEHWARRDYTLDGWFEDWGPSKLHASMLIVHGTNDNNVRPKQSILMYEACKKAGVDVKFIWDQGAHMTPTNHQIGPYVYQEWQNLWYSKYLYKVDNDVLDLLPEVFAQSNLTGDYEGYDTWHSVNKLVLTNKDRVTTSPIAAPVPDREYEVPVEYDGPDLYLTGGIPPSGETETVSTTAANDPPPPPAITGADDP
ncbi:MAG: prolyl oligopeptidase family serine peptidase, partial [Clostridiales bacterium]|nr:prolyl oligopeptidase family serine peptidase [Clostridiales bacterium]